jgi:hypothetical protein
LAGAEFGEDLVVHGALSVEEALEVVRIAGHDAR